MYFMENTLDQHRRQAISGAVKNWGFVTGLSAEQVQGALIPKDFEQMDGCRLQHGF